MHNRILSSYAFSNVGMLCVQASGALRRSGATPADARGNYHDFRARSWKRSRRVLSPCLLLKLGRGRLRRFLTISYSDSKWEQTVAWFDGQKVTNLLLCSLPFRSKIKKRI